MTEKHGPAFRVKLDPRRLLYALPLGVAAAAALLLLGYGRKEALAWGAALLLAGPLRLELGERGDALLRRVWAPLSVAASFVLVELLSGWGGWAALPLAKIAWNLILYALLFTVLRLISGRTMVAARLLLVLSWGAGMANSYVYAFRGRAIFPADLFSMGTALNVAGNYDYTPSHTQLTVTLAAILLLELSFALPRRRGRQKLPWRGHLAGWGGCALCLALFYGTGLLSAMGITPQLWYTRGNGFLLNFADCIRLTIPEKPEGYSREGVEELAAASGAAEDMAGGGAEGGLQPVNLIVIMNESFSDLGVLGEVETNQDWMPFYRSLTENTVKGTAYSSVFGGNTANSEYEFLTGNTMAFLPVGAVAYQFYTHEGDPSLVSQLERLGYGSLAMHAYLSSGWNRVTAYGNFGFDSALFTESYEGRRYCRYYVSDQSNYENLIAQYEAKGEGEPLFLFNVTMQNHSPYTLAWDGLERTVWLTGEMEGKYPDVDQYLSLIYKSDQALEVLLDYFSQVEEPTMVVMFGDHQPKVDNQFYVDVMGGELSDLPVEEAMHKYQVPFLIWANYDIPEGEGVELSLNYLSTLVAQTANLPLTGYQTLLSQYYQDLPVITAMGFRDGEGTWSDDLGDLSLEAQEAAANYRCLMYNSVFDRKGRLESLFFLPVS